MSAEKIILVIVLIVVVDELDEDLVVTTHTATTAHPTASANANAPPILAFLELLLQDSSFQRSIQETLKILTQMSLSWSLHSGCHPHQY